MTYAKLSLKQQNWRVTMYISLYTALDAACAASEKSKSDSGLAITSDERATVIDLLSEASDKEESQHATDPTFILGYN